MEKCKYCAKEVSDGAEYCSDECSKNAEEYRARSSKLGKRSGIMNGIAASLAMVGMLCMIYDMRLGAIVLGFEAIVVGVICIVFKIPVVKTDGKEIIKNLIKTSKISGIVLICLGVIIAGAGVFFFLS